MRALEDRYRKPVDSESPKYYEPVQCSECSTKEDLLRHKYSDDVMCVHCLNIVAEEIAHKERVEEEERQERMGRGYRDDNEALTLYERNK